MRFALLGYQWLAAAALCASTLGPVGVAFRPRLGFHATSVRLPGLCAVVSRSCVVHVLQGADSHDAAAAELPTERRGPHFCVVFLIMDVRALNSLALIGVISVHRPDSFVRLFVPGPDLAVPQLVCDLHQFVAQGLQLVFDEGRLVSEKEPPPEEKKENGDGETMALGPASDRTLGSFRCLFRDVACCAYCLRCCFDACCKLPAPACVM